MKRIFTTLFARKTREKNSENDSRFNLFPEEYDDCLSMILEKYPDMEEKIIYTLNYDHYSSAFTLDGSDYQIPYRTSHKGYEITPKYDDDYTILLYCLLTRDSSGWIREKYLKKILDKSIIEKHPFVLAYIFRLLGEYVQELWVIIYENRKELPTQTLVKFRNENILFFEKNHARNQTYSDIDYGLRKTEYNHSVGNKMFKYIYSL